MNQFTLLISLLLFSLSSFAQTGEEFEKMALEKIKSEDYVYALGLIDRAITEDSQNARFYLVKAKLLNQLSRFDEVHPVLEKAAEVEPESVYVLMEIAEYYRVQNDVEKSIGYCKKALLIESGDSLSIKCRMANIYQYDRQYDKAKEILDEVLAVDPNYFEALVVYSMIYSFTNEAEKAVEYSKRVLEAAPENPTALQNAGYYLTVLNKPEEALPYFNQSIELDPEESFAYNNRGYAYYLLGRYREALADIEKSIHLYDSNSYAYRNLGLTYLAMGKTNDACKALLFARRYGFEKNYGSEVNDLLEKHCR